MHTLIHLLNGPSLRGAERFAIDLALGLAEAGVHQRIIFLRGCPEKLPEIPNCKVVLASDKLSGIFFLRNSLLGNPEATVLCHGQGPQKAAVLALIAAGKRRPRLVVKQIGMMMPWIQSFKALRLCLNRILMAQTDLCVCLGPRQAAELRTLLGVPEKKISLIPNGRRIAAGHDKKPVFRLETRNPFEILMVGALAKEKNLDLAFDLFARLHATFPQCSLTLLGDGPMRGTLEKRAADEFPPRSIRFEGYVEHVSPYLERAGILFLCSNTEGVPGVVIEATLAGLPTVAWEVGDIATVLENNENGRLVPFGDAEALLSTLLEVLGSATVLQDLFKGTAARAQEMSFERIVAAYSATLDLSAPRAEVT